MDDSSFTFSLCPPHSAIRLFSSSTQDTPKVQGQGRIPAAFHEHCCFWAPPSWIQKSQLQVLPQDYGSREGWCTHSPILEDLSADGGRKTDEFKTHPKNPLSISVTMAHNRNKYWDQWTLSQEINLPLCELPEVLERLQKVWRGNSKKHTQETLTRCH